MTTTLTKIRDDAELDDLFGMAPSHEEDEFPHGWRRITEIQPDGTEIYNQWSNLWLS